MRRLVAALGLVAVLVAGCGDEPDPGLSPTESSPTPSPTRSLTGTLLDYVPDEPVRPEDAKTEKGAIAFAEYVVALKWYSYGIADSSPYAEVVDLDYCRGCVGVIEAIDSVGDTPAVARGAVTLSDVSVNQEDEEFFTVRYTVTIPEVAVFDTAAPEEPIDGWMEGNQTETLFSLRWVDDRWVVYSDGNASY